MNGNIKFNGGSKKMDSLVNEITKIAKIASSIEPDVSNINNNSTTTNKTSSSSVSSTQNGKTIKNKVENTVVTKVSTQGTFNFDTSNAEKKL